MNSKLTELYFKLSSLVIFRDILNCRTMRSLERLLKSLEDDDTVKQIQAYSDFVSNLYRHHNDLSSYILTPVSYTHLDVYKRQKLQYNTY